MDLLPNPDPLGLPVPPEWLLWLKVAGFWLHMIFMNLWLAGLPVGLVLLKFRPRVSKRLFKGMPFFMAFGINAGIVPLLFIQTLYARYFYPATILQAWFWFLVIPLLCVAYYGVYLLDSERYRVIAGIVACVLLVWIGFTFSSAMTFTAQPGAWEGAFQQTAEGGAVSGTFLYVTPEVMFRYGMVFGMALATVGAYLALDSRWFSREVLYRTETRDLAPLLVGVGLLVYGVCGMLYRPYFSGSIGTWTMFGAGAGPVCSLIVAGWFFWRPDRWSALGMALIQSLSLLGNAVVRQLVQSSHLGVHGSLEEIPVRGEWGSVWLFLGVFLMGLVLLGWIVRVVQRRWWSTA